MSRSRGKGEKNTAGEMESEDESTAPLTKENGGSDER